VRPAISIVVPVFNVERYLRECLDSVVNQTLADIEIVCVDDASTDRSPEILREYAARDPRIRLVFLPTNQSLSQARKDGVLAATGEYILFLDSDDWLERNACEILLHHMREQAVDILHFGIHVETADEASSQRVASLQAYTRPHAGRLEGRAVFDGFFREELYHHTIWNKLYAADLCRRAFACVEDGSFPKAQDLYAYCILAFFARSYAGLPGVRLYHYRFGTGVTGRCHICHDMFRRFCEQAKIPAAIRRFLEAQGEFAAYQAEYDRMYWKLLGDCTWNWRAFVVPEDQAQGFDLLVEKWGAGDVIASLARQNWKRPGTVARAVAGAPALACRKTAVKTLATYYHKYSNGGVQRVISLLIPIWREMGCEVVLFTDEPPSPDDYPLPEGVRRVVLPGREVIGSDHYEVRARALEKALRDHRVDVLVHHAWASPVLLWDLLTVKSLGIPFVVNTHSVFYFMIATGNPYFAELPAIYRLCDAVVALSRVDLGFWSHFAPRAFYLPNPLTYDPQQAVCAPLENQDVLWVGRFSKEKRPLDAIRIIAQVIESVPAARLLMLGKAAEEEDLAEVEAEMDRLGMRDHVVLCGFHQDVGRFYQAASVYLSTSHYEGFPTGLAESKCHGLPCVMYDLPSLEMVRDGEGLVTVPQEDTDAAAKAVARLLNDKELRVALGAAARQSIEKYAAYDLAGGWRRVLESVVAGFVAPPGGPPGG
jgi:glycosyltransferase involved in cell wall biosynthesis